MAKRGQNEGSIYKREDGRWAAAISLGWRDGKHKRKTIYGKTRKEVQEQLTSLLKDQQQGLPISTEQQTLAQFLTAWLADCVKPVLRPATYSSYSILVNVHIIPKLGHIKLTKLNPQHLQAFFQEMLVNGMSHRKHSKDDSEPALTGLSSRTVQYLRAILSKALNQAVKWNLIPRNIAMLVESPRVERKEFSHFTPEQALVFLEACKGDRLESLFSVALALGLRRGEALGLRWSDIELQNKTLRINAALQRIEGELKLVEPKTKKSRRSLPLPDSLVASLKSHRLRQLQEKLAAADRWQETGLVFATGVGTPIDPRNLKRTFDRLLEKAKLPHLRFHDLRHTCATLLLAQNVAPRIIMDILGHNAIRTTMDIYAHVMPETKREAADIMEQILTGKKKVNSSF